MKKTIHIMCAIILSGIFACENTENNNDNNKGIVDINLSETEELLVSSANDFAFDIFSELEKEFSDNNIFYSPLSMSIALSMSLNGAVGETKDQIKEVIDFGDCTDEAINKGFKSLQDKFTGLDPEVEISLANSAWYTKEYTLLDDFKEILNDYFNAEIDALDFTDPTAKDVINSWIEDKTEDKIKDMISELSPTVVLVLVNAIYFNGTWKYAFDEDMTYEGNFYGLDDCTIKCDFMESGKIKTKYVIDETKTVVTLPYGQGNFEMVIYMPTSDTNMSGIISGMTADGFKSMLSGAEEDTVIVHMPKFKIETETISLKEMLKSMGMVLPFFPNADFSKIFGFTGIFIDEVLHKAYIDVNEEGTEAAAATVVIFDKVSAEPQEEPKILLFNNSFLFFIREKSTGEILFAGKLVNPIY